MTAPSSIDPAHFLHEQLAQASPDLLRQMLRTFIDTLMSAPADAVCGADYGVRWTERTNVRNGYRTREFDTRAGTLDVAIPKLRSGYAHELNPVEPVRAHLKRSLANLTKHTITELTALVKIRPKRMQCRRGLLVGFLASTDLEFGPFL
jgi:hypothetical protein